MSSEDQFSGKVFLVTGASSGIGEALVLLLASRGACVTLCGQNEERLEDVRKRCVQESGGHEERFGVFQGSLQESEARKQCVQMTITKFGKLDTLVNSAGIFRGGSCVDVKEEDFDEVMNVNLKAVFFLIQQAVPYLEKTQGSVVTVSSVGSTIFVSPTTVVYAMGKAAIDHMTRCLALDLASKGIRVNAVNPSFVPTRILRDVPEDTGKTPASYADVQREYHPLGNRCVTGSEVARTILFLASQDASFITGECLLVDGGRSMMGPIRPRQQ